MIFQSLSLCTSTILPTLLPIYIYIYNYIIYMYTLWDTYTHRCMQAHDVHTALHSHTHLLEALFNLGEDELGVYSSEKGADNSAVRENLNFYHFHC